MKGLRLVAALAIASAFAGLADAQAANTISLTATSTGPINAPVPTIAWSTSPAASSCTASGSWSGTKAGSGAETFAALSATSTYTLTCTWTDSTAKVSWTAPTLNTDGTPLTDLAKYQVNYGLSVATLDKSVQIGAPNTSQVITGLTPGTWYFKVRAINSKGVYSDFSNAVSKVATSTSSSQVVSVTVVATPAAPTDVAVQ